MTSAAQITSPVLPRESTDDYATVLARRLNQPLPDASWGLLTTVILGVASFGVLPLLLWPGRFRDYVTAEARAIQELCDWARLRGKQPAAVGPILAAAEDIAPRPIPWLACLMLGVLLIGVFVTSFLYTPLTWEHLFGVTYYYRLRPSGMQWAHTEHLHRIWIAVLSVGYLLHWLQVRSHLGDMIRFIDRFNPAIESEMLPPIATPDRKFGLGFTWIIAGVLMAWYGAWWGIPMLLAAAAQRRYVRVTGAALRRALHVRMCDIAAQRRMPAKVLQSTAFNTRCINQRCMAPVRTEAKFCTRCGSSLKGA